MDSAAAVESIGNRMEGERMNPTRRRLPSPALVVACAALFVALGGTSFAAYTQLVPRGSVGTPQLKNNAVTSAKVRNRSLRGVDFAFGQLPAGRRGPIGPQGPAGPAGAAGPAGPAGAAGAPGPSDAFGRFRNGPVDVPVTAASIAHLDVTQAGRYVIWAKAALENTGATAARITCELRVGTDSDPAALELEAVGGDVNAAVLAHVLAREFTAADGVDLVCSHTGTAGTVKANNMKIAAIKVANLANSAQT
jgi:stage V sporulation protein SpoVS